MDVLAHKIIKMQLKVVSALQILDIESVQI